MTKSPPSPNHSRLSFPFPLSHLTSFLPPLRTIHALPTDQWPKVLGKLHEDFLQGKDMSNWAKYLPNNDGTKGGYHHPKTGAAAVGTSVGVPGTNVAEVAAATGEGGDTVIVDVSATSPKAGVHPPTRSSQR